MVNRFSKSTLTTYNNTSQTLDANANVVFSTNYKLTGCSIRHTVETPTINIASSGLYLVTFSASGVESGTAGDITLQLFRNGIAVPSAIATANSASATDIVNLSNSTIIEVDRVCPCANSGLTAIPLTLVNTGVGATFSNISLTVIKLA